MVEMLGRAVGWASGVVWGPWTVALLLGSGLYLTLRFRFVQLLRLPEALRALGGKGSGGGGGGVLTPFQAFMTGLAASVGTGNIAGVATAIVTGGPGAVFWLWVYGFFAAAIKFAEAVLGMRYRQVDGARFSAGPMHYLRDGLKAPRLALAYGLIAGVAALVTTPFTQPNSIAVVFSSQFQVPAWVSGVVLAVLTWVVVIGGAGSIGRAAEKLAPLMVGLYLVGGLIVVLRHAEALPGVLALIVREAFSLHSAAGGAAGVGMMVALRYGLARGIYANEAGYGTAAVAYGSARSERPLEQGLNAVIEVFIVTFITCTLSALTVLVSGVWQSGAKSTALVAAAFDTSLPGGGYVVALSALLFGYTTLIGWAYYGEQFLEYVLGGWVVKPYRWLYCALVVLGATTSVDLVWAWGDLMNGLQVFPNLVGLLGLAGVAAQVLRPEAEKAS
ncbi:MAG: amino acid carrier protein [Thermoanaerobaculia bacterium]